MDRYFGCMSCTCDLSWAARLPLSTRPATMFASRVFKLVDFVVKFAELWTKLQGYAMAGWRQHLAMSLCQALYNREDIDTSYYGP